MSDSNAKSQFQSMREWVVEHKLRAIGSLWLSGIAGSIAYNWSQPGMKTSVRIIHARHIIGDENLGIIGLAFSDHSELRVSYRDEFIYLFSKDMGSDLEMETDGEGGPQVCKGHRNCVTVKGVIFFGPKCEYVVSGSDCGRMFIWRKSDTELIRALKADKQVVNCINPTTYNYAFQQWD